jgi:hypothetical protein
VLDAGVVERHQHIGDPKRASSGAERRVASAAGEREVALSPLAREPLRDGDREDRAVDLGEVPRIADHVLTKPVRQGVDERSGQPLLTGDQDPLPITVAGELGGLNSDVLEKGIAVLALAARLLFAHGRELLGTSGARHDRPRPLAVANRARPRPLARGSTNRSTTGATRPIVALSASASCGSSCATLRSSSRSRFFMSIAARRSMAVDAPST